MTLTLTLTSRALRNKCLLFMSRRLWGFMPAACPNLLTSLAWEIWGFRKHSNRQKGLEVCVRAGGAGGGRGPRGHDLGALLGCPDSG